MRQMRVAEVGVKELVAFLAWGSMSGELWFVASGFDVELAMVRGRAVSLLEQWLLIGLIEGAVGFFL